MKTYKADYVSDTSVRCAVEIDGIRAPATLPVYVTPRVRPIGNRKTINEWVDAVTESGSANLIVIAPAPRLTACRFDISMLRVSKRGWRFGKLVSGMLKCVFLSTVSILRIEK